MECFSVSAGRVSQSHSLMEVHLGYAGYDNRICMSMCIPHTTEYTTRAYSREEAPIDNARDLIKVVYDCLAFLSMPGTII